MEIPIETLDLDLLKFEQIKEASDKTHPFERTLDEDRIAFLISYIETQRLEHVKEISNLRTMIEALKSTTKKMGA